MTKNHTKQCIALSLATLIATVASGCGKTTTTAGSGVTVSGQLATSGGNSSVEVRDLELEEGGVNRSSVSSYSVDCVTLGSSSVSSCAGTCDSGGNFSCGPLPTGSPFGCFVEQGSTIVAVMAFTSSTSGIGGTNTSQGTIVAGGGTSGLSLGQITLNVSTGTAVVNMANVTSTGGSAPSTSSTGLSTFANLERASGWTIAALPSSQVPPGVSTAVTCSGNGCNGPGIGQKVFLAQYQATDSNGGTHVGLSIWDGSGTTAHTNYDSCTGGGGEGANLPTGFSPVAGPNNNASKLNGALAMSTTLPAPSAVVPNGYGSCGVTSYASGKTCADTPTLSGFSDPDPVAESAGGYGTAGKDSCVFLCVLNNISQAGGACSAQTRVDWGKMGQNVWTGHTHFAPIYSAGAWTDHEASITGGGTNVSFAADAPGTVSGAAASYLGGSVVFNGSNPSTRFMFGELIVSSGGIGSLSSQQPTQTFNICTTTPTNNTGCPSANQVTCSTSELDQMTITETGVDGAGTTNAAVLQLTQNRTLQHDGTANDATDYAACTTALGQNGNNIGQRMFIFQLNGN